ncbi:MAG: triose-phosphate isomerase [Pseudomonadota bacterium]
MNRRIAAGNWKMHGSRAFVADFVRGLEDRVDGLAARMILFPPLGYLPVLRESLAEAGLTGRVEFGGQNLHPAAEGAFTGEFSGEMLKDLGASWALVGHSERRQYAAESNELVAEKAAAALRAGLRPMICVGEAEAEREAGQAVEVVTAQINAVLDHCGAEALLSAAVAYEPVWAIGTGRTATPELAQEMHAALRGVLRSRDEGLAEKMPILYGGSVKAANAAGLFAEADIDGGLVGGASLDPSEFLGIVGALGS